MNEDEDEDRAPKAVGYRMPWHCWGKRKNVPAEAKTSPISQPSPESRPMTKTKDEGMAEAEKKATAEAELKKQMEEDARQAKILEENKKKEAERKAEAERISSLSLLERMREEEKGRIDAPLQKVDRPSFESIEEEMGSEILRSGSLLHKEIGNQVLSAGSFSDSAIADGDIREYSGTNDSNQDVVVINREDDSFNGLYLVFDGVSRSTLPRQWAEILAKKIINERGGLQSLLDEERLGKIWKTTEEEFEGYMERNRAKITDGMMEWMKNSVPDFAATTLVALEIKDNHALLVCHGDSCAFVIKGDEVQHLLPKEIGGHVSSIRSDMEPSIHGFEKAEFEFVAGVDIVLLTDGYSDPIHKLEPVAQRMRISKLIEMLEGADKEKAMKYTKRMISEGDKGFRFVHDDMSYLIIRMFE